MAKRKAGKARASVNKARKRTAARSAKRPTAKAKPARKPVATAKARKSATPARTRPQPRAAAKVPRLERARRTLDEVVVPTPPSSLNLDRHGSAARTGRAEIAENL